MSIDGNNNSYDEPVKQPENKSEIDFYLGEKNDAEQINIAEFCSLELSKLKNEIEENKEFITLKNVEFKIYNDFSGLNGKGKESSDTGETAGFMIRVEGEYNGETYIGYTYYDILTEEGKKALDTRVRADSVKVGILKEIVFIEGKVIQGYIAIGGGVRYIGDLGGKDIQEAIHLARGYNQDKSDFLPKNLISTYGELGAGLDLKVSDNTFVTSSGDCKVTLMGKGVDECKGNFGIKFIEGDTLMLEGGISAVFTKPGDVKEIKKLLSGNEGFAEGLYLNISYGNITFGINVLADGDQGLNFGYKSGF